MNIPLSLPDITELERQQVLEVLKTPHLSLGPKLTEFENKLANYVGVKHAVAANSGTSALHLVVSALGIGEGDEVITTAFSFVASANCILYQRAVPVFADIDPKTLNIDPQRAAEKITPRTKAILAVDVFGHPADWSALQTIAEEHDLLLIEDSAEALGAEYNGKKAGAFGRAAVFGFYPNKQLTTGEGGAALTDDDQVAALCRSLRNQGRGQMDGWLEHERLGYNYRLSEINCALGIAQLSRIDQLLQKRARVAQAYQDHLGEISALELPYTAPGVKRSWFVYVVVLAPGYTRAQRDSVLRSLRSRGIGCANYFPPIHLQPFYCQKFGCREGDLPITESVAARSIALPFHGNLTADEVVAVAAELQRALAGLS